MNFFVTQLKVVVKDQPNTNTVVEYTVIPIDKTYCTGKYYKNLPT